MKTNILRVKAAFVGAMLSVLASSCSQNTQTADVSAGTSSAPRWQRKFDRMQRLAKPGMSKQEVVQIFGDPIATRYVVRGNSYGYWLYEVTNNINLKITFNDNECVVASLLDW